MAINIFVHRYKAVFLEFLPDYVNENISNIYSKNSIPQNSLMNSYKKIDLGVEGVKIIINI